MDASFNWLKSVVLENRRMFDNAIRMMKMDRKMYQWKYNIWQNGEKKCPEPHLLTDQDKLDRIEMLKQKKESFILKPFDEDQHPHLAAYKKQIQIDRDAGNLESIDTMLKTGIFWTTVKCPKCAREETVSISYLFKIFLFIYFLFENCYIYILIVSRLLQCVIFSLILANYVVKFKLRPYWATCLAMKSFLAGFLKKARRYLRMIYKKLKTMKLRKPGI